MSDFSDIVADMRTRIVRLEEHAQNGLIDRGELRRETAVLKTRVDSLEQIVAGEDHVDRADLTAAVDLLKAAIAQVIERLSLVQRIVFGAVGAILFAVLTSLIALVVRT